MVKRIKNHGALRTAIAKGMDAVSQAYNDAMIETITEPYQWPEGFGLTIRRSGEVVEGSFRNIVDLGNLRRSQLMTRAGYKTIFEWSGMGETPPVIVHEGATLPGGKTIPPRRWTEVAVTKVDWVAEFYSGFG